MPSIRIGVLAIQGDYAAHAQALAQLGCATAEIRQRSELAAIDGLVIPGGETTTLLRLLRAFDLWEPLRGLPVQGVPIFGTCAGLILLAREVTNPSQPSLGLLDVAVRRNGYGRQIDSFVAQGEVWVPADLQLPAGVPFSSPGESVRWSAERPWRRQTSGVAGTDAGHLCGPSPDPPGAAGAPAKTGRCFASEFVFIRAPVVTTCGPRVEILATCEGIPVLVREGDLLGASYHPELSRDGLAVGIFAAMVMQARERRRAPRAACGTGSSARRADRHR